MIRAIFPDRASNLAGPVDNLYFFLIASTGLLAVALAALVITFAIRYRRRHPDEIPQQLGSSDKVEIAWTGATFLLFLTMFFWSSRLYFAMSIPQQNALEIYAIGKQWMWKLQHPGGQREINELHIPVGRPIRVTLASQDVVHSFFVPDFRVKQDAVPGRYTTLWFTATKPGRHHLFCAEYCGLKHSGMIGYVYAMEPAQFAAWLTSGAAEGSLSSKGQKVFQQHGCANCHDPEGRGPGPNLRGVWGSMVRLSDGSTVLADEAYLRRSILRSQEQIVYGFQSIMPVFQGQITEEEVIQLVEYIRALGATVPDRIAPEPFGTQPAPGQSGVRRQQR